MSNIVVLGAGLAGMSAAYELREGLGSSHRITVVGEGGLFGFTPSNPWLAVGWRKAAEITINAAEHLARKDIGFNGSGAVAIDAPTRRLRTGDGQLLDYDYLLICTGPKLAFEEVPGSGPDHGYTQSVCTTAHAAKAWTAVRGIPEGARPDRRRRGPGRLVLRPGLRVRNVSSTPNCAAASCGTRCR